MQPSCVICGVAMAVAGAHLFILGPTWPLLARLPAVACACGACTMLKCAKRPVTPVATALLPTALHRGAQQVGGAQGGFRRIRHCSPALPLLQVIASLALPAWAALSLPVRPVPATRALITPRVPSSVPVSSVHQAASVLLAAQNHDHQVLYEQAACRPLSQWQQIS